jgi:hypothetical protein
MSLARPACPSGNDGNLTCPHFALEITFTKPRRQMKGRTQVQNKTVTIRSWYNHLVQVMAQMYEADVLPCESIAGDNDSFRVQKRNIADSRWLHRLFMPAALPGFRIIYNWIYD